MTRYCDKECRDNAACSDACKGDEVSESTLNDVLCADCGAKMMEHEGIIKSETVYLDIVYEGEPICEPCLDARCLTARENAST